jgi:hypothetical protein
LPEGLGLDAARTTLGVTSTRDEACTFEDLEVLGDRRLAHFEGFGKLENRSIPFRQASQDGATCWISEGSESSIEAGLITT